MPATLVPTAPPLDIRAEADGLVIAASGMFEVAAAARCWAGATERAAGAPKLRLDLTGLTGLDTAGAVLLLRLEALAGATRWDAPPDPALMALIARTRTALDAPAPQPAEALSPIAAIGAAAVGAARDTTSRIAFLGEALVASLAALRRPARLRGNELLRHLDEAGFRAFGLTILLGVLIGLILAFQSSVPLKQFGTESFIPNLVGLSLTRELGPLLAGVILSGRTGSAYAAELGTMTVNEEVDALRIMGIDPIAWLVLPRVLAAILVMPVLTLLLDLAGLIGMGFVMLALGYPPVAVVAQVQWAVTLRDVVGGLVKAAAFGLAIGLVGCRAGLGAGRGPRAVGDAATAAVVGGIVAIVLLDGIFAILFYRLGV